MPGRPGPAPVADLARAGALVAAAVLALTSTGDVLVVALALGLGAGRVLPGVVAAAAGLAATTRWGTPDLADLAASQAVLGPAGLVGPATAAASSWVAGMAVLLAWTGPTTGTRRAAAAVVRTPGPGTTGEPAHPGRLRSRPVPPGSDAPTRRTRARAALRSPADVLGALAIGAFAAALTWGPGPGGAWPGRVLATVLAAGAALAVGAVARRGVRAAVAGAAAVVLAAAGVVLGVASRPGQPAPGPDVGVPWAAVALATAAAGLAVVGAVVAARRGAVRAPGTGAKGPLRTRPWPSALGHASVPLAVLAVAARAAADLDPAVTTSAPPSGGVAAAGSLAALAALVGVLAGPRWAVPAAAPALVAVAHGLLASPTTVPAGAIAALGTATAVTAVALVVSAAASTDPGARVVTNGRGRVEQARAVLGVLGVALLAATPPLWRWVGVEGLEPWERGVLAGTASALVAAVVLAPAALGERGLLGPTHRYAPAIPGAGHRRARTVEPAPGPDRRTSIP